MATLASVLSQLSLPEPDMAAALGADLSYHLLELAIATANDDARRSLPELPEGCRRVLDVGCGIGQTLVALDLPPGVEAFGIDVDPQAIAYGQKIFPNLRLQCASGEQLPFPDACIDFIICRVALPYMHIPTALAEFRRVLVDGGTVWATFHSMEMAREDFTKALRAASARNLVYRSYAMLNSALLLVNRQIHYPLNRTRIESYQTRASIRHAFTRAGFTTVSTPADGTRSLVVATR